MGKVEFINIADIKNPKTGKTYREENEAKVHNIKLGTLVEVELDEDVHKKPSLRLYVVDHKRDCDGTPLYGLSFDKNWSKDMYGPGLEHLSKFRIDGGYPEECLKVCE